jgi:hypothetical protein
MDIQEAALFGKLPIVRKLLAETTDAKSLSLDVAALNLLQFWGFKSSEKARLECLRLLLQAGADPNAINQASGPGQGCSLLAFAVHSRCVDAVKAVVAAGADLGRKDKDGSTILDIAGVTGTPEIRAVLEQAGGRRSEFTTIAQAAFHGDVQRVRELLAAGSDPLDQSERSENPLFLAAFSGHAEVCRLLLEAGLDIEAGTGNESTPLMTAALWGHVDVVRLLIEHGANVRAKRGSNTPLKAAYSAVGVTKQRKQEMLALLENASVKMDPAFASVKNFAKAAQQPAFLEAVRHVGGLLGSEPKPWKKRKGVYQYWRFNSNALPQAQADARAAGFCLVRFDTYTMETTALLFPSDKYAVIAALGTNTNGLYDANDLILWLRDMERENPFELTECGFDLLSGTFSGPVVNALPLAERMIRLCPEQSGPAEALANDLEQSREFGFWWD